MGAADTGNVSALWHLKKAGARIDIHDGHRWDLLSIISFDSGLEQINCLRAMNIVGINPNCPSGRGAMTVFICRMDCPQFVGQSRPTQLEVFTFFALVTEIQQRNWEAGLFMEHKHELDESGELGRIRNWLGWQWQQLYDNDELADRAWHRDVDDWPSEYDKGEDSVDYNTAILFREDGNGSDEDGDEFFDALG
ncbi:hypothetical protein OQA88_10535 [Cercophora sp. LCS_1]